jgi:hypothetical protein
MGKIAVVPPVVVVIIGMIPLFFSINWGIENGIHYVNFNPIPFIVGILIIVIGLPIALMVAKELDC